MSEKDWGGNKSTAWALLGASNHTDKERQCEDFYATHPVAMEKLLERESFSPIVWEPAVGQGHLAEVLKAHGHEVICSDILDRGYENTIVQDFLRTNVRPTKEKVDIITNPPYKFAQEFVQHALDISLDGTKIAMFLKIQFLEGNARYKLFMENPPKHVYVFSRRVICAMNGWFDKFDGSAFAYCWFVWEKGFKGEPTLRWIGDLDSQNEYELLKEEKEQVEQSKRKKLW